MNSTDGRVSALRPNDQLQQIKIEFMVAYENGEDISRWIARHPEHAIVLTDLAIALEMACVESTEEPSNDELAATTEALRRAREKVLGSSPSPSSPGLVTRARALGHTVPQLAEQIRLSSDILFKIDRGMIRLDSLPHHLIHLIAAALNWPVSTLPTSLVRVQPARALYHAKQKPVVGEPQTFVEALNESEVIREADRSAWIAIACDEGLIE